MLVWSLHPDQGVDVRLADYGVSQFSTPSGLWRHKGTEEYMAPELFKSHRNQAYDEKVGKWYVQSHFERLREVFSSQFNVKKTVLDVQEGRSNPHRPLTANDLVVVFTYIHFH